MFVSNTLMKQDPVRLQISSMAFGSVGPVFGFHSKKNETINFTDLKFIVLSSFSD